MTLFNITFRWYRAARPTHFLVQNLLSIKGQLPIVSVSLGVSKEFAQCHERAILEFCAREFYKGENTG